MNVIINFLQDLKGYSNADILSMGKMYDLQAPVNDLRWMIAILHSTKAASMFSGGIMSFVELLPKLREAAEDRNDDSFPSIDKSYVEKLQELVRDQKQFKKQLRKMTREEKQEKEAALNERERALKDAPGWAAIQELREKIPAQHSKWILDSYIAGTINKIEDIQSRLIPAIKDFESLKKAGKIDKKLQLQKLAGLKGLEDLLDEHQEALAEIKGVVIAKEEAKAEGELIYDGKDIKIVQPLTEAASCYYGQGTRWCTAATQAENMFEQYHEKGPLFIIQPKRPKREGKEKYQLHFETASYMDEKDQKIKFAELYKEYPEIGALREYVDVIPAVLLKEADLSAVKQFVGKEGLSNEEVIKLFSDNDKCDILNYLIDNYDVIVETKSYQGKTALIQAVICNGTDRLGVLLRRGADIEAKDNSGMTALMWAAWLGKTGALKLLLDHKADIEAKDQHGRTALIHATDNDETETLKLLLDKGADIEARDILERTALMYAVLADSTNSIKILLEYKVDLEAKDEDGKTALNLAAKFDELAALKILLKAGAQVDPTDPELIWSVLRDIESLKIVLEKGIDPEVEDGEGHTPLIVAAGEGLTDSLKLLLEYGADIEAKDDEGHTALIHAAARGHLEILKLLLEKGLNLEEENEYGMTALNLAATNNQPDSMKLLLEAGAKVSPELRKEFPQYAELWGESTL